VFFSCDIAGSDIVGDAGQLHCVGVNILSVM